MLLGRMLELRSKVVTAQGASWISGLRDPATRLRLVATVTPTRDDRLGMQVRRASDPCLEHRHRPPCSSADTNLSGSSPKSACQL